MPASGASVTFQNSAQTTINLQANRTVATLLFDAGADEFTLQNFALTPTTIINSSSVTQTIASAIGLTSSRTFTASSGLLRFDGNISLSSINTNRTLTLADAGDFEMNGIITNGASPVSILTKSGAGTVTVDVPPIIYDGIVGDLIIGDGLGAAQSAILRQGALSFPAATELIGAAANVTILSDGLWNLNNQVETIGSLTLQGRAVNTGLGIAYLTGDLTTLASAQSATIATGVSGSFALNDANRIINLAYGAAASDLAITGQLINGGFTKTGDGTLTLSGNNTFLNEATIAQGIVNIQSATALGANAATAPAANLPRSAGAPPVSG